MKRLAYLVVASLFLMSSCVIDGGKPGISGNGKVVEESRDIQGFTGIKVSSGIDVLLSQGNEFQVVVEADENLLDVIVTELEGHMLVVDVDRYQIRNAKARMVHITMPEIEEIHVSSAGDCIGKTPIVSKNLRLNVSSAGDLNLEVDADRIYLDISSSGDVELKGETGMLEANLSSAGDLDAFDLDAVRVHVEVSSAGDASVFATEELSMSASSAGNIYYRGSAKVLRSNSSSAGRIINKN